MLDYRVLNIFEVSNSKCIMLHLRITEQKYFFSKCENFLMIYSHLLKKCLMESFIFSTMYSVFSVFLLFTFNLFSAFIFYYIFNSFHANDPFLYGESLAMRYSGKKGLLKISQNSQENICARVSFLVKLQAKTVKTLILVLFCEFLRTPFFFVHFLHVLRWLLLHTDFLVV